jgi:predicted alpha/beta-hydrolase family hydrolase
MGGRIASHVVSQGAEVDRLVAFAYPLHPPGKPDQRRDAHLPAIPIPTLFISGTNDTFGTPDELRAAAALVSESTVHFLEGADHSFRAPKRLGRPQEDLWREAVQTFIDWLPIAAHR